MDLDRCMEDGWCAGPTLATRDTEVTVDHVPVTTIRELGPFFRDDGIMADG